MLLWRHFVHLLSISNQLTLNQGNSPWTVGESHPTCQRLREWKLRFPWKGELLPTDYSINFCLSFQPARLYLMHILRCMRSVCILDSWGNYLSFLSLSLSPPPPHTHTHSQFSFSGQCWLGQWSWPMKSGSFRTVVPMLIYMLMFKHLIISMKYRFLAESRG